MPTGDRRRAARAPYPAGASARLPLAIVSFVLGFAFTALQDVGDWVTYSDHSLAQLGVYVGKGVGFDLVHAAGCFGFALLFGPSLIRTLKRFRARIQVNVVASGSGRSSCRGPHGVRSRAHDRRRGVRSRREPPPRPSTWPPRSQYLVSTAENKRRRLRTARQGQSIRH